MRYKKTIYIIIAAFFLSGALFSFAAIKTQNSVANTINTGGIKINSEVFTEKNKRLVPLSKNIAVDIYDTVSYVPVLKNIAENCFIRVKFDANNSIQDFNIMQNLYGIDDYWVVKGNYIYYTKPFTHNSEIKVCKGFMIPQNWQYKIDKTFKVKLTAEAIQAKHFTPDFNSEEPWGDVGIVESDVNNDYVVNTVNPSDTQGNIKVIYDDQIKGITINSKDFFENVDFMPGDTYNDSLTISNNTKKPATVMFKTEYDSSPLLESMNMRIENKGIFYEGKMAADELKVWGEIAKLKPGEKQNVDVTLSLPVSADNKHQVSSDKVKWYFAIQQEQPKTGDSMFFGILAAIFFASGFLLVYILKEKRNN